MSGLRGPRRTAVDESNRRIRRPPADRTGTRSRAAEPSADGRKTAWWVRHYTFTGTAVGLIFIWFSMTPSLLPRGPLFQGLVSGVSGAIGYGLGVFAVWLVRYMRAKIQPAAAALGVAVLIPVGVVGQVLMAIWFHVWQDDVRNLMGVAHLEWYDYPLTAILSLHGAVHAGRNRAAHPAGWWDSWSASSIGSCRSASRRPSWSSCSWR